jgi:hypothetical protein
MIAKTPALDLIGEATDGSEAVILITGIMRESPSSESGAQRRW